MRSNLVRTLTMVAAATLAVPAMILSAGGAQAATPHCDARQGRIYGSTSVGKLVGMLPIGGTTTDTPKCLLSSSSSYNSAALALQGMLIDCYGMSLPYDGYFGNMTKSALMSVQRSVGVDDDGIYGPATGAAVKWAIYYSETSSNPGGTYGCRVGARFF